MQRPTCGTCSLTRELRVNRIPIGTALCLTACAFVVPSDPNSNDPATSVVLQALKTLEENKFVDQYSRVVMIDMNL